MKKLFIFGVLAVVAFASQAAQFDWQYSATSADVGKTVYVLLGSAQTSWESVDALSEAAVDSAQIKKKVNKYNASSSAIDESITATSAQSVYYVIVSSDGTTFDVTSVANMSASVYDPALQQSSSGQNTSLSSASITSSGNSFGGGGDIPEPTSGLLLLVGAGMLALRRKQK